MKAASLPKTSGPSVEQKTVNARYYQAKAVFTELADVTLVPKFQAALDEAKQTLSPKEFIVRAAALSEQARAIQKEETAQLKHVPPERRATCARAVTCMRTWRALQAAHPDWEGKADRQCNDLADYISRFATGSASIDQFDLLVGRSICDGIFTEEKIALKPFEAEVAARRRDLEALGAPPQSSDDKALLKWQTQMNEATLALANAAAAFNEVEAKGKQRHADAMRKYKVMD